MATLTVSTLLLLLSASSPASATQTGGTRDARHPARSQPASHTSDRDAHTFGRELLQNRTRTRAPRRSRAPRAPRAPRSRRARPSGRGSTPPGPPSPPAPPPPVPPPPLPVDNPNCPEAPTNLWINELVWRVNGPGEFVEIAGPPGVDSTGWMIGECDQGDGSEGLPFRCRRAPIPAPPLSASGGLNIGSVETNLRTGTDEGIGLINPCNQVVHGVTFVGGISNVGDPETQRFDNLEFLDADFFPLGTSMSLTGQGASLADFSFNVTQATPGAINAGQNTGPPLPTPPTPPASCGGLAPLWINEINFNRTNIGEFWEVAAAPGADSTGWTMARCQRQEQSDTISRPTGCGASRVPIPPLQATDSGLLIAWETTTLANPDADSQGLGLFNPCGEITQLVTFDGDYLEEVDGVEAVILRLEIEGPRPDGPSSFGLVGQGSAFEDFAFDFTTPVTPGEDNPGQEFVVPV